MAKGLNDLQKKLIRIEKNLAEEVAPEIGELFKESVRYSLIDYYNSYDPNDYKRTYNFLNISNFAKTSGKGNVLTMRVDSGSMDSYPGWFGQPLQPSTAFDFFFMNGEHGHKKWLMHTSIPPYLQVDEDVQDGFGGRVEKIVNRKIEEILR